MSYSCVSAVSDARVTHSLLPQKSIQEKSAEIERLKVHCVHERICEWTLAGTIHYLSIEVDINHIHHKPLLAVTAERIRLPCRQFNPHLYYSYMYSQLFTSTLSQADVSRLQNDLENAKAEAVMQQQRSKAELEEAQRVTQRITKERDELQATIEQLNNVNRE